MRLPRGLLVALLLLLIGIVGMGRLYWLTNRQDPLTELAAAVGSTLDLEPRLTGGFQPRGQSVLRGSSLTSTHLPPDARIAIARIEKQAALQGSREWLGALGVAYLVEGDIERSVATLEEAARLAPANPRLMSDLAAAYMARAARTSHLEDAARAIDVAQRAIDLDPTRVEAKFNLALSLEALRLPTEARTTWERYLQADSSSVWAREAKRHLDGLESRLRPRDRDDERLRIAEALQGNHDGAVRLVSKQTPDTAYEYVENELLPRWADAWLAREGPKAAEIIRHGRLLADALVDAVGDRMPADAIAAVEQSVALGNRSGVDGLARSHRAFAIARGLYQQDRYTESGVRFEQARSELGVVQSPFEAWTVYYVSTVAYYRGDLTAALPRLDALIESARGRHYSTLLGRALRFRGLLRSLRGDVEHSLEDYQLALSAFDGAGAKDNLSAIHSIIAQRLEAIGNYRSAWAHRQEALVHLNSVRNPHTILLSTAMLAKRQNLLPAALALQNEALSIASKAVSPVDLVEVYLNRSDVQHQLGRDDMASADVQQASTWATKIGDSGLARRFQAEAGLAHGELIGVAPAQALASLTSSLAYFLDAGMDQRLARIYQAMGRVYSRAGRVEEAEASYQQGLTVLERQRSALPSGGLRLSYFDLPWNLFDDMIALQSARPETARRGLTLAERARARDLADTLPGREASLLDPAALAMQLSTEIVVVYYVPLQNELLMWLIQRDKVDLFRDSFTLATLAADAAGLRSALERRSVREAEHFSERLFDELIRPFQNAIPRASTIVFIPEGILHAVPFAALRDRRAGRYLIEDHSAAVAPSATMFARARERLARLAPLRTSSVLVIGNPLADATETGNLPALPGAEAESAQIAALYQNALVLTGSRATKSAFLDHAGAYGIVHFGGHAVANDSYPLLSRLFFARGARGESGVLFSNEVLSMNLEKTGLIVLAACRTAVGPIQKGEGVIGLARPFLARGVPSVIATLWDVDDRASQVVFESFYIGLRGGAAPADALRTAQLTLLRQADATLNSPVAWAGFVLTGGIN